MMKNQRQRICAAAYFTVTEQHSCIVITGTGKAFCTGQDINELGSIVEESVDYFRVRQGIEYMQNVTRQMLNLPKPIIAAVNGYAIGAGAELVIACDIRYASHRASFAFSEVKMGLFETNGVTWLLPRLIGLGWAKQLMLTAEKINVDESLRIGLVTRVFYPEELMDEVMKTAGQITKNAPVSVRYGEAWGRFSCFHTLTASLQI